MIKTKLYSNKVRLENYSALHTNSRITCCQMLNLNWLILFRVNFYTFVLQNKDILGCPDKKWKKNVTQMWPPHKSIRLKDVFQWKAKIFKIIFWLMQWKEVGLRIGFSFFLTKEIWSYKVTFWKPVRLKDEW